MKKDPVNQILERFAATDGLLRGTALFSNVVATASFALLAGFGDNSILMSGFVQLTISGILELPTGWIADQFGWALSVKWALRLKYLVTLAFLLAVIASAHDLPRLAWTLVGAEALADAFAGSFLSGAYEAAYLKWYETELKAVGKLLAESPSLFLASYRHGWKLRFAIPLSCAGLLIVVQAASGSGSRFTSAGIAYVSIALVLVLRTLVYKRVNADLRGQLQASSPTDAVIKRQDFAESLRSSLGLLRKELWRSHRAFVVYCLSTFLAAMGTFFFIGESLRTLNQLPIPKPYVWLAGVVLGILIYLFETLFSIFVFPRISRDPSLGLKPLVWAFFLLSTANILLFQDETNKAARFAFLATYGLLSYLLGSAIIKHLNSRLADIVSEQVRATWASLGNGLGLLAYGTSAGLLIAFNLQRHSSTAFAAISTLVALFMVFAFQTNLTGTRVTTKSFREVMGRNFLGLVAVCLIGFTFIDLVGFAQSIIRTEARHEVTVADFASQAIFEPLSQGSFPEASRRLEAMKSNGTILCAKLLAWSQSVDSCDRLLVGKSTAEVSRPIKLDSSEESKIGEFTLYFERTSLLHEIAFRIACALILAALGCLTISQWLRRLGGNINIELTSILAGAKDGRELNASPLRISEFRELAHDLQRVWNDRESTRRDAALATLAQQVAHDIRSPLAALKMIGPELTNLPEDTRLLVRSAVNRISDIANNLLSQNRLKAHLSDASPATNQDPHLVTSLVESLISEKRLQFRSRIGININIHIEPQAYGMFAQIDAGEFKRVLSNLINNSVEAIETDGTVDVLLGFNGSNIAIRVVDNGKGIPPEILPQLMSRGKSHDKPTGSGLGLYHAKYTLEAWGGDIGISSSPGQGTTITLLLPKAASPIWFAAKLELRPGSTVVVLDDDNSIHQIWRGRLETQMSEGGRIEVLHFSTAGEISAWHVQNQAEDSISYLIDYELLEQGTSGLEIIQNLGIAKRSILVTSRYDEPEIRRRCKELELKLIPKSLAASIPILVS